MRPKHLAIALSRLSPHPCQEVGLEQYPTEGDLAAYWMLAVDELDGLTSRVVMDLGAGNGILGIACLLLGAEHVHFVECDEAALEVLKANLSTLEDSLSSKATVHATHVGAASVPVEHVEIVVMNPPWGVQQAKADRPFLLEAFTKATQAVHLLHSDRAVHPESVGQSHGWDAEAVLRTEFRLPAMYAHHAQRTGKTGVQCWRFFRPGNRQLPVEED